VRDVFEDTVHAYVRHSGAMLSAALAFYVLLAAAPFGVFLVALVGAFYGEETARAELIAGLTLNVGPGVAAEVGQVLDRASHGAATFFATAIGMVLFFLATSRVFETVRSGLNHVWEVVPIVPPGLRGAGLAVLERRIVAFTMVLFCGFVFLFFVVLRATLDVIGLHLREIPLLARVAELISGWVAITFVTAVVYRRLPDARIVWQDALVGAAFTGLLSVIGAAVAGQYVSKIAIESPYGAAGSIVAFLLWVYYCSQVFFFGAEFTAAWSRHRGDGVHPLPHARRVTVIEHVDETIEDEPDAPPAQESSDEASV